MTERQLFFVFKDTHAARIFVRRLVDVAKFKQIAIYIREEGVIVIDGADEFRRDQIYQLARSSGADLPAV